MNNKNITISKQFFTILLTTFLILGLGISYVYHILLFQEKQIFNTPFFEDIQKEDISLLNQVSKQVKNNYYNKNELSSQDKVDWIISGYVKSLWDIHSEYLNKESAASFKEMIDWDFEWIWTYIEKDNLWILVTGLIEWWPAEKSWIEVWDIIYKANTTNLADMPLIEAVTYIKWEAWTSVELELYRKWEIAPILITVVRKNIVIPSVKFNIDEENKDILYVRFTVFDEDAYLDIKKALEKLKKENLKWMILDLRMNSWWLLSESVNILSLFIEDRKPLVTTRDKSWELEYILYSKNKSLEFDIINDLPLVILIDKYSASASEITAQVLREYEKAILIWTKSYWKWSVQNVFDLNNGWILKLTIAHWFTPDNTVIEWVWITPDVISEFKEEDYINSNDRQLNKARTVLEELILNNWNISKTLEKY